MGRGRGRGGRRGGAATTTPTQEQKVVEKSPLTKLIEGLLEQAYTNLSEAERPKADKKGKAVEEFEKTTRQLVAVDHTEYQRLVISLSTMLSLNGIVSGINAKKVIGIVFTYLISEVTRYWHQYGFTKEEVHPTYV